MTTNNREFLQQQIDTLERALPIQAPLNDFVHFNPLMHYEDMPFKDALQQVHEKTGAYCYLPASEYREAYQKGRITKNDLLAVFHNDPDYQDNPLIFKSQGKNYHQQDIALTALTCDIKNISYRKLLWKIEEDDALHCFQQDIPNKQREHLLASEGNAGNENNERTAIHSLWQACLQQSGLSEQPAHFSKFVDLSPLDIWHRINDRIEVQDQSVTTRKLIRERSEAQLHKTFSQVGQTITMRVLLQRLTNTDILEEERPILIRQLSAWLDLGMSSDTNDTKGFYHFWKEMAQVDLTPYFDDLITWNDYIDSLSDDPLETIMTELMRIGISKEHWRAYLRCLALEMPGWSGMFNWRAHHAQYQGIQKPVEMADYLAVRLVLEHLFCRHVSRDHWQIDATLPDLRGYFKHNLNEFFVRHYTYNEQLPEYLQSISDQLLSSSSGNETVHISQEKWREIAHLMLTWLLITEHVIDTRSYQRAWRLFHASQHLGLNASSIASLKQQEINNLLSIIENLDDPDTSGYLWLRAYEHHYKKTVYQKLIANHAKGRWQNRDDKRPAAQIIFCMDDREESMRRHLEDIAPEIETIGAAGVFGLPNNFKALDADKTIKLAQPVVTATYEFDEVCDASVKPAQLQKHQKRHKKLSTFNNLKTHSIRRSVLTSTLALPLLFPLSLSELLGRSFFPVKYQQLSNRLMKMLDAPVKTRINVDAKKILKKPDGEHNQIGLSQDEQVEQIAAYLKLTGFTRGFSQLIVLMAHRSRQLNNPHILAYGCGACSGRFGGPNARAFVNIANDATIRKLLAEKHQIIIPEDSWFVAAEHDTTGDQIEWFDTDLIPDTHKHAFRQFKQHVIQASSLSAQERCIRFASAPQSISVKQAATHVRARAASPDQPRAELGHQGCAVAFIGRRSTHQGIFWDRRAFMVSYDPFNDPDGNTLQAQLLGNGVVGVGIAMDYYFSRIQNGYLGSGNKATHNIAGNFGVMDGTSSDLQTGLARQMTELHEPMRLLVIVETTLETIETVYERQKDIRRLVDNEWIILAVKNPDTAEIHEVRKHKKIVKIG